jgi:putative CocE/NonD family hydrolase
MADSHEPSGDTGSLGIITELDVPATMRDGVTLRADVVRPEADGAFPGLLVRTPYGKFRQEKFNRFVRAGYVVVVQDSRGRYASDGDFVPFTVENTGDAEDGYDSVEWLAAQPYCNGRIGTMGYSYNGWMQWQLARLRPPHLLAMCACTIPLELTAVDWPGGFRPGRRIRWWMANIAPDLWRRSGQPGPHTPDEANQLWDETSQSSWLGFLPWLDFPKHLPKGLAEYAEDWLRHPNRTPWKFAEIHREVDVPNLDFSGWYDHCNDTMRHLPLMQNNGRSAQARSQTKLIAGPWNHPGLGDREVCGIDFGELAAVDKQEIIIRWFDHWLKGIANGVDEEPAVRYFVMGTNRWKPCRIG